MPNADRVQQSIASRSPACFGWQGTCSGAPRGQADRGCCSHKATSVPGVSLRQGMSLRDVGKFEVACVAAAMAGKLHVCENLSRAVAASWPEQDSCR